MGKGRPSNNNNNNTSAPEAESKRRNQNPNDTQKEASQEPSSPQAQSERLKFLPLPVYGIKQFPFGSREYYPENLKEYLLLRERIYREGLDPLKGLGFGEEVPYEVVALANSIREKLLNPETIEDFTVFKNKVADTIISDLNTILV